MIARLKIAAACQRVREIECKLFNIVIRESALLIGNCDFSSTAAAATCKSKRKIVFAAGAGFGRLCIKLLGRWARGSRARMHFANSNVYFGRHTVPWIQPTELIGKYGFLRQARGNRNRSACRKLLAIEQKIHHLKIHLPIRPSDPLAQPAVPSIVKATA